MRANLSISLLCGLFLVLGDAPPGIARRAVAQRPAQPITVELASGRSFTARMDSLTDEARLWLRWTHGSASLLRPIRWDRVVQVQAAGETLSGDEFHRVVKGVRREVPKPEPSHLAPRHLVMTDTADPANTGTAAAEPSNRDRPPVKPVSTRQWKSPRVRSLEIDVAAANWDADVEVDGLIVDVYPLDAEGSVVGVDGVLSVELIGQRRGPVGLARPFCPVGRWTERVWLEDIGPCGARYRLPFQRVHPEFDLKVEPYGAVHARLSVPGQGVFEATASMVRVRPFSATRDDLEQATGHRFFRSERTGRGRR